MPFTIPFPIVSQLKALVAAVVAAGEAVGARSVVVAEATAGLPGVRMNATVPKMAARLANVAFASPGQRRGRDHDRAMLARAALVVAATTDRC